MRRFVKKTESLRLFKKAAPKPWLNPVDVSTIQALERKPQDHPNIWNTHLQHAMKTPDHLKLMLQVADKRYFDDCIALKPKRSFLHSVIAHTLSECKTSSTEDFNKQIRFLISESNADLPKIEEATEKICRDSPALAKEALAAYQKKALNNEQLNKIIAGAYDKAKLEGRTLSNSQIEPLVQDYLIKKAMDHTIDKMVLNKIHGHIKAGDLNRLEKFHPSDRITYMLCGGAATGKGVLFKRLLNMGFETDRVARLFPDELHGILKAIDPSTDLGSDKQLHGSLLCPEAGAIIYKTMQIVSDDVLKGKSAPHAILECILPSDYRRQFATMGNGRCRILMTAHDNPELVIDGCYARFKAEGRLVPTHYVLLGQQQLASSLPSVLKGELENPGTRIEIHDTTHIHDKRPAPQCPVAIQEKSNIMIFNIDAMLNFQKKKYLNPETDKPQDVYQEKDLNFSKLAASYFADYKDTLKNLTFIEPDINIDKTDPKQHTYAHIDESGKLVIDNQKVYDKVIQSSEAAKSFFEVYRHDFEPRPTLSGSR